jgi:3'(2'), 5'-bisphosphate nucleotidase
LPSNRPINIHSLLVKAVIAAKKAGDAIVEVYGSDFTVERKEDRSPLTLADRRSHEIISGSLQGLEGPLPLLSEEGRDIPYSERKAWGYYWLVDPLDGTKEFVKKNGEFTVNIALMHRDRPVMGVVFLPVKDILYFAAENTGAFKTSDTSWITDSLSLGELQGKALRLPIKAEKGERTFTAIDSRSHMSDETRAYLEALKKEHGEVGIISAGSSLKFCLVLKAAEGISALPTMGGTLRQDRRSSRRQAASCFSINRQPIEIQQGKHTTPGSS